MTPKSKHTYTVWRNKAGLSGLAKVSLKDTEVMSNCRHCGLTVKIGGGGYRYWVNGAWVAKRPPCVVKAQ
jgi:hypothetical protein